MLAQPGVIPDGLFRPEVRSNSSFSSSLRGIFAFFPGCRRGRRRGVRVFATAPRQKESKGNGMGNIATFPCDLREEVVV
jgi:hypothetical protein